jgi:hypothetical protein
MRTFEPTLLDMELAFPKASKAMIRLSLIEAGPLVFLLF